MGSPAHSPLITPNPPPSSVGSRTDFPSVPASPTTAAMQEEQARALAVPVNASQEILFGSDTMNETADNGGSYGARVSIGNNVNDINNQDIVRVDFQGFYGNVIRVERETPNYSTVTVRVEHVPNAQIGLRRVNGRADLRSEASSIAGEGHVQGGAPVVEDQATVVKTKDDQAKNEAKDNTTVGNGDRPADMHQPKVKDEENPGTGKDNRALKQGADKHDTDDSHPDESNAGGNQPAENVPAQNLAADNLPAENGRHDELDDVLAANFHVFDPHLPDGMDRNAGPARTFLAGYQALRSALWAIHDMNDDDDATGLFSDRPEAHAAREFLNIANVNLSRAMSAMYLAYEQAQEDLAVERMALAAVRDHATRMGVDCRALEGGVTFLRWENNILQFGTREQRRQIARLRGF